MLMVLLQSLLPWAETVTLPVMSCGNNTAACCFAVALFGGGSAGMLSAVTLRVQSAISEPIQLVCARRALVVGVRSGSWITACKMQCMYVYVCACVCMCVHLCASNR